MLVQKGEVISFLRTPASTLMELMNAEMLFIRQCVIVYLACRPSDYSEFLVPDPIEEDAGPTHVLRSRR